MTQTRLPSRRCTSITRSLLIVSAIGGLAACGSSSKMAATSPQRESGDLPASTAKAASATTASPATTAAPASAENTVAPTSVGAGAKYQGDTVLPTDRKRIVTVGTEVEVKDVGDAAIRVGVLAEGVTGFVNSQQTSLGENPSATLVVKIPPEKLSSFLESINGLGKVLARTQQSEDITAAYTDLEARITTKRASVARVRELVAKAASVAELAQVESELTARETELEQLLGQQRVLDVKSEFATVTVTLRPIPVPVATTTTTTTVTTKEKLPGQTTVLKRSTKGLIGALYVAWILVLALLPWVIVASIVLGPVWLWFRRRRRAAAVAYAAAKLAASPTPPTADAGNLPEPVVQTTSSSV
jgi:hypothetical protein